MIECGFIEIKDKSYWACSEMTEVERDWSLLTKDSPPFSRVGRTTDHPSDQIGSKDGKRGRRGDRSFTHSLRRRRGKSFSLRAAGVFHCWKEEVSVCSLGPFTL